MTINRNKLYTMLLTACAAGYIWIYFIISGQLTDKNSVQICLIKNMTNIPCPSCGTTRSVLSLLNGNFSQALHLNPMGFIVASIMILSPIWIVIDFARSSSSLFNFYRKAEFYLIKAKYSVPLIVLLIINWMWNITKGV